MSTAITHRAVYAVRFWETNRFRIRGVVRTEYSQATTTKAGIAATDTQNRGMSGMWMPNRLKLADPVPNKPRRKAMGQTNIPTHRNTSAQVRQADEKRRSPKYIGTPRTPRLKFISHRARSRATSATLPIPLRRKRKATTANTVGTWRSLDMAELHVITVNSATTARWLFELSPQIAVLDHRYNDRRFAGGFFNGALDAAEERRLLRCPNRLEHRPIRYPPNCCGKPHKCEPFACRRWVLFLEIELGYQELQMPTHRPRHQKPQGISRSPTVLSQIYVKCVGARPKLTPKRCESTNAMPRGATRSGPNHGVSFT